MPSEPYEITFDRLTYGGEALGRLPDGRAIFVPFVLPGERARVQLFEEKRGFTRGQIVELLQTAPERIVPRCRHFGICGGCHYQHMPYEMQLRAKAEILHDQLQRIGKVETPPVSQIIASPKAWNYRNHVQFHLTAEGKPGYVSSRANNVMEVAECHLPEESIDRVWLQLDFESETDIERLSLRAGLDDELMLVFESSSPETPALETDAYISITHVFDDDAVVIAGDDHLTMKILDRDFHVSPASFFQTNTAMAEKMVRRVLELLPGNFETIVDVYCGVGLFSAFLAQKCDHLIGIESSSSACEDFAINLNAFENVELYEDLAANALPTLDVRADVILADPPRAGLERAALDAILAMRPVRFIYVSCDPSTLARDAKRLISGGYRLTDVTLFDLFPQTFHIESISLFES